MNYSFKKKKIIDAFHGGKIPQCLNKEGIYIAGGAVTSVFTNTEINDIDIYFKSKEIAEDVLHEMYNSGYRVTYVTEKAVSLQIGSVKIQLIVYNYFETVQDIFNDFDFSVNMGAYDIKNAEFILDDKFMYSLADRSIRFNNGTKYPLASLCRTKKYLDKGFVFSRSALIRLGCACAELSIDSWDELESQVGGIYGKTLVREGLPDFSLDYALDNLDAILKDVVVYRYDAKKIKQITGLDVTEDVSFPAMSFAVPIF